ncbi:hypothetical protein BGZ80_005228 [Entomortierella chlamydospora]|uniref:Uncharacterized protein n=1 Tax=Entomortierella chlamydospora TaxID=101097 RepID=A0A9P6MKS8_9FUNG|nr:hypothetical protein BGZ79_003595 [Entomortierella chlamydospora]KAG0006551.1 hypothetical protein BGZ80_005228 [Entomortierella chlamydospora]
MNSTSSFSGSLDHRSMTRANSTKRNKSLVHLPVTQQQQDEQQQRLPTYEKPLPRVPIVTFPTPPNYQTKEQRAAFLSSAPVRSQVTISQRNKNLTPATTSLPSKSTPSFFTSSLSASTLHLNMGNHYHSTTDVITEKRRRSGDSMKDPKDSEWFPATTVTSSTPSSFPSEPLPSSPGLNSSVSKYFSDDEEDEYDAYELEAPSTPSTTTLNDSYFNVERNYSALMSQDKKSKKKCRLFGFITKK